MYGNGDSYHYRIPQRPSPVKLVLPLGVVEREPDSLLLSDLDALDAVDVRIALVDALVGELAVDEGFDEAGLACE